MFRSLPGATVFYPSDAVATERSVELAANTKGITFIRVARPATEVIYDNDEVFEVSCGTYPWGHNRQISSQLTSEADVWRF